MKQNFLLNLCWQKLWLWHDGCCNKKSLVQICFHISVTSSQLSLSNSQKMMPAWKKAERLLAQEMRNQIRRINSWHNYNHTLWLGHWNGVDSQLKVIRDWLIGIEQEFLLRSRLNMSLVQVAAVKPYWQNGWTFKGASSSERAASSPYRTVL